MHSFKLRTFFAGFIYHDQAKKLKLYLRNRYSSPPIEATSIEKIKGKRGILFIENSNDNDGSIGLWDGTSVIGRNDFTHISNKLTLWYIPEGKCP